VHVAQAATATLDVGGLRQRKFQLAIARAVAPRHAEPRRLAHHDAAMVE
jgi:hypothetical protein